MYSIEEKKNIYRKVIDEYGVDNQVEMVIEECSELILALQKLKRYYGKSLSEVNSLENLGYDAELVADVCNEIADVKVMMEQSELIFDKEAIQNKIDFKIKRLELRVGDKIND